MKCNKIIGCRNKPIIRFQDKNANNYFCLECLVDWLDYIKENKFYHLLEKIEKIIPIYTF